MLVMIFSLLGLIISTFWWDEWSYYFCSYVFMGVVVALSGYVEGWYFYGGSVGLFLDLISWSLVFLTLLISSLMMMASVMLFTWGGFLKEFCGVIGVLTISLVLVFLVSNLLWFYVFFEGSLIPTLFLISGWGYQPERLKAGVYLFFYTMTGSLPLLLGILFLHSYGYSIFHINGLYYSFNSMLSGAMSLAFLVKMPMFLTHLWLPKAHVEAPISGSMVLAGVLLKLGGYGLFRILPLFQFQYLIFGKILMVLSLWGGACLSILCLRQFDLKALIAYSSVVHMGMVIGGLMVMSSWGLQGVIIIMIGHGLCSSGLFAAANIFYERGGTRSMLMNKGMMSVFPGFMLWWFLLSVSNMAAPPSLNLLGEVNLLVSLISWSVGLSILLGLVSFFSAGYSLYMFSLVAHGRSLGYFGHSDISVREYMLIILHWIPLNFMIFSADLVMGWA